MSKAVKIIIVDENNDKHIVDISLCLSDYENFKLSDFFTGIVSRDTFRNIGRPLPCENVYLIQERNNPHYKIGYTKNTTKRLQTLQKGNPETLKYLGYFPGGRKEEQRLQHLFNSNNTNKIDGGGHEWFNFDEDKLNQVLNYFREKRTPPIYQDVILIRDNGEYIFVSLKDDDRLKWADVAIKYCIPFDNIDNVLPIIPAPNNYILIRCNGSHKYMIHKSGKDAKPSVKNLQTGNRRKLIIEATSPINVATLVDKPIGKWFDSNNEEVEQIKQDF